MKSLIGKYNNSVTLNSLELRVFLVLVIPLGILNNILNSATHFHFSVFFQCDHVEIQKGESENGGGIDQCYMWTPRDLSLPTELFYLYSFPQQNCFIAGGRNFKCPFVQVCIDHCIPISSPPVSCFMSYKEQKFEKRSGLLIEREDCSSFGHPSRLQLKMSK